MANRVHHSAARRGNHDVVLEDDPDGGVTKIADDPDGGVTKIAVVDDPSLPTSCK
jgi:hypothetical protein